MVVKVRALSYGLVRYIGDHRGIVDSGYRKGSAVGGDQRAPGSVARERDGLAPFQSAFGMVIVATRSLIVTVSWVLPEYVQVISASVLSTSET